MRTEPVDFTVYDNEYLVAHWIKIKAQLEEDQEILGRIEWALTRHLEADDATLYAATTHDVILSRSVTPDKSGLLALLELIPESDLVEARAYTPEHEETRTVGADWNMTKLKPFANRGGAIRKILEAARVLGPVKLRIKERK